MFMDSRLPFGQFILSGWLASQPKGGNDLRLMEVLRLEIIEYCVPRIRVPRIHGIHWDELDEDISIAGLLAGRGDMTATRKAAA